ncbi:MAG TPA: ParB/RepB/Spo0J family partition protein [Iamia sp.]
MTRTRKNPYVILDPNDVGILDNVRKDLGDIRGLTRSVKELGVLVPAVVVPDPDTEGGHLLVFGQRRQAAAIAAERELPAIVAQDIDDARRVATQLAENLHRKDLTVGEEAAGYEQLAAFDMSPTAIARAVGVTRQHVQKARTVGASEVAVTVADRYDLTLDQALVLAEFEDDREGVKALTITARTDPGQFDHVASRMRQDRERADQQAATVAALTEAGVAVMAHAGDHPGAVALGELTDGDDGEPITPEAHSECPGRAAIVPDWKPTQPQHYCLDPMGHGHRNRFGATSGRPAPTPMSEKEKADRREVIEGNKAWRAAEPVRREYIRTVLARKTPPKGTLRYVAERALARPERFGDGEDGLLADLLGVEAGSGVGRSVGAEHLAHVTNARVPLALLAQVAADHEQAMPVQTWRSTNQEAAAWLAWLASTGYSLSEIEQRVVTEAHGTEDGREARGEPEQQAA